MSNYVITIARGYGSGGKTVGKMLAEQLDIGYHDKDLIRLASDDSGINENLFGVLDEQVKGKLFKKSTNIYTGDLINPNSDEFVSDDNLFNYQAKIIKDLADTETCVIVGRCADYILRNNPNVIKIFVYASLKACIKVVVDVCSLSPKDAEKRIKETDMERSTYYKYHTGHKWNNAYNYDLCLDTSELSFDKCAEIIKEYIAIKRRVE